MKLHQLLDDIPISEQLSEQYKELQVKGITDNSSEVKEGDVFVAVPGYQVDGHHFIEEAINKGAVLVVGEMESIHLPVPYIRTDNSRRTLGRLASAYYDNPSRNKLVIGVTGTNGKTTTTHMIKHVLEENGYSCSLFGTIDYIVNGEAVPGIQTTPGALTLQKLLYESEDEVVVMEVSSHGLEQYRLEGILFDVTVFTNLFQDHLDYHSSMEEYFNAKARLFSMMKEGGRAVINTDDDWGYKLHELLETEEITHYNLGREEACDFVINTIDNTSAVIKSSFEEKTVFTPIYGIHNMYNTIQAYMTANLLGCTPDQIQVSLDSFPGVRGRFETYALESGVTAVIDYAHTADSIEYVLQAAKNQGAKSITHVFGFRGNRDESKRKAILDTSAAMSDVYILTLDDLNSISYEDMVETLKSLQTNYGNGKGRIIPDRTLAIQEAIAESRRGDWVIITGKGHESYQQRFQLSAVSDEDTVERIQSERKSFETRESLL
ncbi:UDP-N-acetylmuramoyl-L-alanyl-D-glutamate--2,6-diaminopimelate ligase [Halobacillus litoralis]|uniref:UDP-N-acetylmuramoyl-L-alanyl-D-glutamate--2, 6-diaminopimelate ligase n=1 Tax=Halobacillus litoralis TaxID=45668 RepID=UPI001CFDAA93|nr:UDP-N-acetylmuramoyl-L-alanyl-D-glutamate--2,6-diaminopimelate ligase [Halobacillus litoralis]